MNILSAIEPTWPPLRRFEQGPFTLRVGAGGGKRVSAATLNADGLLSDGELVQAEALMRDLGQVPMFSLSPDQVGFDEMLAARGYDKVDATRCYHAPVSTFTSTPVPRVTAFTIWEPLAIMLDLWAEGGIGPERIEVMKRVSGAKTGVLGRITDKPGGVAFVAAHGNIAMLHALEVAPEHRRKGMARWIMIAAAHWAQEQGCDTLALLVTEANAGANALYRAMGFTAQPGYHYRVKRSD